MTGGERSFEDKAFRRLAAYPAATVHEAIGQRGALPPRIRPLDRDMRVCGPALPVLCPPGDNLMIHRAIAEAEPGAVLVVDHGAADDGPFGDVLALACRVRGIAGLVIDGCVRDASSLRAMAFPVFCTGPSMRGTTKRGPGTVGAAIHFGDVIVNRGDAVLADEDGVVIVPAAELEQAVAAAAVRETREVALRQRISEGALTLDLLDLPRERS